MHVLAIALVAAVTWTGSARAADGGAADASDDAAADAGDDASLDGSTDAAADAAAVDEAGTSDDSGVVTFRPDTGTDTDAGSGVDGSGSGGCTAAPSDPAAGLGTFALVAAGLLVGRAGRSRRRRK